LRRLPPLPSSDRLSMKKWSATGRWPS
jgi:hypothetical protein